MPTFVNINMMFADCTSNPSGWTSFQVQDYDAHLCQHQYDVCRLHIQPPLAGLVFRYRTMMPTFVNINMMFADCTSNPLWLDQFSVTGYDNCQHFSSIGAHLCQHQYDVCRFHIQPPLAGLVLGTELDNSSIGAHLCQHQYVVCRLHSAHPTPLAGLSLVG